MRYDCCITLALIALKILDKGELEAAQSFLEQAAQNNLVSVCIQNTFISICENSAYFYIYIFFFCDLA